MKKYLFDKIIVKNGGVVEFIPFRKATFIESFSAYTHNTLNQSMWQFTPVSFKEFIKMLSLTKTNGKHGYNIRVCLPMGEQGLSFDMLLEIFAKSLNKPLNKKALSNFYAAAYKVKQEAEKSLVTEPAETQK